MKKLQIFFMFFVLGSSISTATGNTGHRLGKDSKECEHLPENSIEVFKCAINKEIYLKKDFWYFEMDIQESYAEEGGACEYFVFHNQSDSHKFVSLVPHDINVSAYKAVEENLKSRFSKKKSRKSLKIAYITSDEVRSFTASQNGIQYSIPTLDEVLRLALDKKLNVPFRGVIPEKIMIEIKRMRTEGCRDALIEKLVSYQNKGLNFGLLIRLRGGEEGSKSYKKSGTPKPSKKKVVGGLKKWCRHISSTDLFLSTTYPHYDMCKNNEEITDMKSYRYKLRH